MLQNSRVGFDWLTLFDLEEKETKWMIEGAKKAPSNEEDIRYLCRCFIAIAEVSNHDEIYVQACKKVLLNFCVNRTTFAKDMLSDEQYEKCVQLYNRRQFESKLLNELLSKFVCCLQYGQNSENLKKRINDLLRLDIIEEVENLTEQKVVKTFAPLKQQIEKIAGGVKSCCYLEAKKKHYDFKLNAKLNDYIIEQFSYDFNEINSWNNVLTIFDERFDSENIVFQYALFNDKFWIEHKDFDIFAFLNNVIETHDFSHAKKIIKHIFDNIYLSDYGKHIVEKSLPLVFLYKDVFIEKLQKRTFQFTFDRFKSVFDLGRIENSELCYPINSESNVQEQLEDGKKLINEFFEELYGDYSSEVINIITSEVKKPTVAYCGRQQEIKTISEFDDDIKNGNNEEWTLCNILDSQSFGYHWNIKDREAIEVYYPDFFAPENIWNRLYLKAYYMQKLTNNKELCFANLFEVYFDLCQFIEKMTGIKTSHQRNTGWRDDSFNEIKKLLKKYDVIISNEHKKDYIISLLDRKVANIEESERFPVLEQLGDAIYGLAVAEMIFYNPKIQDITKIYSEYITANKQVQIAEKIALDKLYMSSYSLPRKYDRDVLVNTDTEIYIIRQESEQLSNTKKFFADSLEMLAGAICKDCGYQVAIDFCKRVIRDTFQATFSKEVRFGDGNVLSPEERYHYTKILPALYSMFDNEVGDVYPEYQRKLHEAFDKFYKTYVLGTEEKSVRNYITSSFLDIDIYDDCPFSEIDKVFYEYLHNGLKSAIETYGESVEKRYKEIIKRK